MANLHLVIFAFLVSTALAATVTFSGTTMPNIVCHNKRAFAAGKPQVLTRITDKSQIRRNRAAACGKVKCGKNLSCDEYPFASTAEGGKGALVKCVPVKEQNTQGGTLSGFYKSKNVKNGDKFLVQLVNVPSKC